MVPGGRNERWQPCEAAIKLWERLEQQLLRDRRIHVTRIRYVGWVENRARWTPRPSHCGTGSEEALKRIGHFGIEIIRHKGGIVGRVYGRVVGGLHKLFADRRRQEVAVAGINAIYGSPSTGPGQVRAAICGVVHSNYDLPREQVLNPEIPHIDLCIPSRPDVQVAGVAKSPLRELAVFCCLRRRQTARKWTGTGWLCRGRPKTSELVVEIVFGEEHVRRFREGRAGILEICGYIHSVEDAGTTTQHGVGFQSVGEAKTRREVISIHGRVAAPGSWKNARTSDLANLPKLLYQRRGQ